jgi:hypothetical protein
MSNKAAAITKGISVNLRRFPLTTLVGTVALFLSFWMIHHTVHLDYQNENDVAFSRHLLVYLFIVALALPWSYTVHLLMETLQEQVRKKWVIVGIYTLVWALMAVQLIQLERQEELLIQHFFIFALILHLGSSVVPFWLHPSTTGFYPFNHWMFQRFISSTVFSMIIYGGGALALVAWNALFSGHEVDNEVFAYYYAVVLCLFHINFFSAGTPEDIHSTSWHQEIPTLARYLFQWVLIPLVGLYLGIMYLYEIKIVFSATLPQGWLSIWIMVFSTLALLVYLLTYPFHHREGMTLVNRFSAWIFPLLLPLLVLLVIAVHRRVSDYGLTEPRVALYFLSIWLLFITLIFILKKKTSIVIIPSSLLLVALVYVWGGPLSAAHLSFSSQTQQWENLEQQAASGQPVDREHALSVLEYLYAHRQENVEWFSLHQLPVEMDAKYNEFSRINRYDWARNQLEQRKWKFSSSEDTETSVSPQLWHDYTMSTTLVRSIPGPGMFWEIGSQRYSRQLDGQELDLELDDDEELDIRWGEYKQHLSLGSVIREFDARHYKPEIGGYDEEQEPIVVSCYVGERKLVVWLESFNLEVSDPAKQQINIHRWSCWFEQSPQPPK